MKKTDFSNLSFAEQIDRVLSGQSTMTSHLQVMEHTPEILQVVGFPDLPILMTASHLKTITQVSGDKENSNYHDMPIEIVKNLPQLLSEPVMIMDSITKEDSIVVLLEAYDKKNKPVIGAVKIDGYGAIVGRKLEANILTSVYGKDKFENFLNLNAVENTFLFIDKKRSQNLASTLGVQFPNGITSLNFNTIIRKSQAFVNRNSKIGQKNLNKSEEKEMIKDEKATGQAEKPLSERLSDSRALAKNLAEKTGEPYVTIEWTERSGDFPDIYDFDVMPLSVADKKLEELNKQAEKDDGYYKTKLHIDFIQGGRLSQYEACRFDIGSETGGLIAHITDVCESGYLKTDDERKDFKEFVAYLQSHKDLVATITGETELKTRGPLSDSEVCSLVKNFSPTDSNSVIVAFVLDTALRSKSIRNICVGDLDFENGCVTVRVTKNRDVLVLPLSEMLKNLLIEYINFNKMTDETGYLFPNSCGGQLYDHSSLYKKVNKYMEKCGVKKSGTHLFRYTFGRILIENNCNAMLLQQWFGHRTMEETKKYLRLYSSELKQVCEEVTPLSKNGKILKLLNSEH